MAKMTPFKVMTSLLNNQTPTEEEIKTLNSFFMCRWLSNNKHSLPMAHTINLYYNMPILIQYKFCEDFVAMVNMKSKVNFISFSKEKQNKDLLQYIENIQKRYKVNEVQAQEYYNLMDEEAREYIYNLYNEGRR